MQKLAVSNIAWPFEHRLSAYRILADHGVTGLEIAPGLLFADAEDAFVPSNVMLLDRLAEIEDAGLTLVSMQSLLFGVRDAQLFASEQQRANFVSGINRAIDLGVRLAIPHLVLGAPKERAHPKWMSATDIATIADQILTQLAAYAHERGCALGLEPNPAIYGTNFINTTADAIKAIRQVNHPGLNLNLDMGGVLENAELIGIDIVVEDNIDLIGHVHISEPFLAPAPADTASTALVLSALHAAKYSNWVSLEMRSTGDAWLETLQWSLRRLNNASGSD